MAGVDVITLGCRLNALESEVIRREAGAAGLEDAVIVNTCAVTAEAERQARQAIRRARRARPGARLIVTGCAAQITPERYAAMAEVDEVLGNLEKLRAESYRVPGPRVAVDDIMAVRETAAHLVDGFEGRARAFVEVQQGCDHRCTFCIIPFGRGNNRSVPAGEVVAQVRALVEGGYAEVVLTGVDLTGYGGDLPGRPSLGSLVRRVLKLVPELERLRLSSLDPAEIDETLWSLISGEPRLMPHLHLSIQSGDDLILKRMKRRHSRAQALDVARRARALRPEIVLGADVIAGFPTEDDGMAERTLAFVDEAGLDLLHVFPFSQRPGTPAARMPQVPKPVIRERAARLRAAGDAARRRAFERVVGKTVSALVEQPGIGHSEHYLPVRLPVTAAEGDVHRVRVVAADNRALVAEGAA
ncbi:MAG TPA: tRNA (N(6)-L-threonylcarbamoyladenosine(37)-C(2))-methylthiotransferase MtaB [Stellaceae bacterium]|nr:tRNA (N(6)-L-threonylcarbamoyladenosine(37)-C(2))-methylthiotransferase MtaB [Stellaceae bacterium]